MRGITMKINLLPAIVLSFMLVFLAGGISFVHASSDDDFYSDDGGFYPGDGGSSDDGFYSPSDDDFYPPSDDDFYPPGNPPDDGGGDGGSDSGGVEGVSNSPPVISSFSVPATAVRNSDITVAVAATDGDGGVNR